MKRAAQPSLEQITVEMLRDTSTWVMRTHLCVKQRQRPGGTFPTKCGIIMHCECGMDGSYIVVRNHSGDGAEMYGGPFKEKYDSIDSLILAGWVVD